jgi:hypothetical protein
MVFLWRDHNKLFILVLHEGLNSFISYVLMFGYKHARDGVCCSYPLADMLSHFGRLRIDFRTWVWMKELSSIDIPFSV